MLFGISSAPEKYLHRMNEALNELEGIAMYAGDILVFEWGDNFQSAEKYHNDKI